ncbi:MAG TPA: apolipoprotein N-acyltransferase, partial [Rhodocyclaceae bacterium]|nr:apolipoprotein N-acyltransferase [Rhodocyclaceae bacterium]
ILWGLADGLRGVLFTGFPWLALGYSQAPGTPLAGFAPLLGVYGLSALTALAAAMLVRWRVGLPVLLALGGTGYGLSQISWTTPVGPPVRVALVQGNVPQSLKWDPTQFYRTLRLYRDLVDAHPAQLTVLPETAAPAFLDQLPPEFLADLKRLALREQGDLILGTVTGSPEQYWNTALTLGASPEQQYSKSHLVPFGEFIPPGFRWFLQVASIPMSEFSRGPASRPPLAI